MTNTVLCACGSFRTRYRTMYLYSKFHVPVDVIGRTDQEYSYIAVSWEKSKFARRLACGRADEQEQRVCEDEAIGSGGVLQTTVRE